MISMASVAIEMEITDFKQNFGSGINTVWLDIRNKRGRVKNNMLVTKLRRENIRNL